MRLIDYLETLRSNPFDDASPLLKVYRYRLTEAEREAHGPTPYAVYVALDENARLETDDKARRYDQLIPVKLFQNPIDGHTPDEGPLYGLFHAVQRAVDQVDTAGYLRIFGGLELDARQVPPSRDPDTNGLGAEVRFRLSFYWK